MNTRVREIQSTLQGYTQTTALADQDMAQNRVVNVADPVQDQDVVNLRYLKKQQPVSNTSPAPATPSAPGACTFRVIPERFGALTIDQVTVVGAHRTSEIGVIALAVDETDIKLTGNLTSGITTTDPLTFVPSIRDQSRFRRHFEVGDYIVFNDATGYEIALITAFDGTNMTLQRSDPVGSGDGWYGAPVQAHAAGTRFYKLIPYYFSQPANGRTPGVGSPILVDDATIGLDNGTYATPAEAFAAVGTSQTEVRTDGFPWTYSFQCPDLCICVVGVVAIGLGGAGPITVQNMVNGANVRSGGCPGLRTCNGVFSYEAPLLPGGTR